MYSELHCGHGDSSPEQHRKLCGSSSLFPNKLGVINKGPVGPKHGEGLLHRFPYTPEATRKTTSPEVQPESTGNVETRNRIVGNERGNKRTPVPAEGRFSFQSLPSSEERWRPEAGNKSKKSECLPGSAALQDGRDSHPQDACTERRLVGENRSERRLLLHPNQSTSQEIPVFHSRQQDLPIHLSPIRPSLSTMGLYQDLKAGCSSRTGAGDTNDNLHRRYSPDGGVRGENTGSSLRLGLPPTLYYKRGEDNIRTIASHRFLRFHSQHCDDGTEPSIREIKENSGGLSQIIRGGASVSPRPFKTSWQNERCQPGHPSSPAVLQTSPNGSDKILGAGLRIHSKPVCGQQGGIDVVGQADGEMEWKVNDDDGTRPDHRVGCVQPRMGSILSGHQHRRPMVKTRENLAYKLPGVAGSHTSTEDICKDQERNISSTEDKQHNSSCPITGERYPRSLSP